MAAYALPTSRQPLKLAEVYQDQVAVTPTDNTAIGPYAALYVGVGGDVVVCPRNSTTPVTYKNVPSGTLLKVALQGVNLTGTTATNLVALG